MGIAVGAWVGLSVAWQSPPTQQIALLLGATSLAVVGLADDIRPLSTALRLAAQVIVCVTFVLIVTPTVTIALPGWRLILPASLGEGIAVIWLVGLVNVWNFMDGLDGLAGGLAAIAAVGLIAIGAPLPLMLAVAGSCIGFLVWNHSHASIFMGDCGSMFLGFVVGGSVLAGSAPVPLISVALLLAPFLLDASYTLVTRLVGRKPILSAHHEHLYQRLAASGIEHRKIAGLYWLGGGLCALLAIHYGSSSPAEQVGILLVVAVAFAAFVLLVYRRQRTIARI